jgi:ATP synthase proteolipid subunit
MSTSNEEILYWPAFFGYMGVASALIFANAGAAYGTARSGNGLAGMAITNPGAVIKNIIPIIMAGILGIYGLIVAVILLGSSTSTCVPSISLHPILFCPVPPSYQRSPPPRLQK